LAFTLRKVGIVGVGHVGAHVAYSLALQGLCDELYLCDINKQKVISERQDLLDAVCYMPHRVQVYACDYEELAQCDVIVNSVGKIDSVGKERLAELQRSVDMIRTFVPLLKKARFNGLWLNITNPCDIIAREVWKLSGLPKNQVLGTGTGLDTSRLKAVLARETGIDHKSITAYQLGEHGNSQFTAWSAVAFGGKPLSQLEKENPEKFALRKDELGTEVAKAGWVTFEGKGATEYGIAATAARMIGCILHDEKQIFPASTLIDGHYDEKDTFVSVPCVLGRNGIEGILDLELNGEEMALFHKTCSIMRENIAKIK
jgi:L-lactate dehydrogenase